MAENTTVPAAPTPNDVAPQNMPDDSKQWADLAAELEEDKTVFEQEGEDKPADAPKPDDDKTATPEPDRPKPTYEQLEAAERGKTAALKSEREARRRAEENMQAVHKLIDDLRASRQQQPRQPEPTQPKIPDVNEDPIGHFQARTEMLERALEQTHRGSQQTAEHIRAQQEEQVFWGHVRNAEAEFRKTSPTVTTDEGQQAADYDVACHYLRQHRMAELAHMYPDGSPVVEQEARQWGLPSAAHLRLAMLHQDATSIAQRAFQLGISPAQLYYNAAKERGYKTPNGVANGKGRGNGQIEAAKRGQKAALTISGGEGRKSSNDMTLNDLSELWLEDKEAFDKEWDRMKAAGKL